MPLAHKDFINLLISQLTEKERKEGIAYAAEKLISGGSKIQFNKIIIEVPTNSYLGFIDREPQANWGHSARYVIIDQKSRKISSLEARLPPFKNNNSISWHVVYKAPGVPDIFSEQPT